VMWYLI